MKQDANLMPGIREGHLEFFPDGHNNSPDGKAGAVKTPSPVHLAHEETMTVIGMWSDFVGMLATIPPTTGLVS